MRTNRNGQVQLCRWYSMIAQSVSCQNSYSNLLSKAKIGMIEESREVFPSNIDHKIWYKHCILDYQHKYSPVLRNKRKYLPNKYGKIKFYHVPLDIYSYFSSFFTSPLEELVLIFRLTNNIMYPQSTYVIRANICLQILCSRPGLRNIKQTYLVMEGTNKQFITAVIRFSYSCSISQTQRAHTSFY